MRYYWIWAAPSENVPSGHARTVKTQIRRHRCAVWSKPSLSAARMYQWRYYRMYQRTRKPGWETCACARWYKSAHFAHAQAHFRKEWPIYRQTEKALRVFCWFPELGVHSSYNFHVDRAKRKGGLEHAHNAQIQIHTTHAQSLPGIWFSLIHSMASKDIFSGQRKLWSNCTDAQADLILAFAVRICRETHFRMARPT